MKSTETEWSKWMIAGQKGDASAYHLLLSAITPVIKKFLKSRLFNSDAVEDVTQEILLALHSARQTYRPEQPFQNWMYGIARHKMLDYFRKQMRQTSNEVSDDDLVTFLRDPSNNPEESLSGKDLKRALDSLSEKQREVLTMTKLEGYSMADAAAKLGMTETAVKVTAHRGYQKLKEWLIVHGYE